MNHQVFGNRLSRPSDKRKALYKGLISELLKRGRIETTLAKARAVLGGVDKALNRQKVGRTSGHARIITLGPRLSDGAKKVVVELVDQPKK